MSIRDRLVTIIGGKPLQQKIAADRQAMERIYEAYLQGPYRMPTNVLLQKLSELDSATVMQLVRQLQYGGSSQLFFNNLEDARTYQMEESRYQWLYSPLAQWSVNTWTSFGLGDGVKITCKDPAAQEIWDNTVDASTIFDEDQIFDLSNYILVDGNLFFAAFISTLDGSTVFRLIDNDEIAEIITLSEDKTVPLYYKRVVADDYYKSNLTYYYPDWHTYLYHPEYYETTIPTDGIVTTEENMDNETVVLMLHSAHNRKNKKSLYGWPILGVAAPYLRAHKGFLEDRLTVVKQKAMFVRELNVDGGSRAVKGTQAIFDSQLGSSSSSTYIDPNPPAIAGSTFVHNKAVEYTDLPLSTSAGDATGDNNIFSWMALLGAGLFPTSAGLDTSRWATALEMDKVQSVQWSRYQTFWSAQFDKMVELTLTAAEEWGSSKLEDKTCKVSIDTLNIVDFPGVVAPISQVLSTISTMMTDGVIPLDNAKRLLQSLYYPILSALGTENLDDILSDEAFGMTEEAEEIDNHTSKMSELARQIYEIRTRKIPVSTD